MKPGREELSEYLNVLRNVKKLSFFSSQSEWVNYGYATSIEMSILEELRDDYIISLSSINLENIKFILLNSKALEEYLEFVENEMSKLERLNLPQNLKENNLEDKSDNKPVQDIEYRVTYEHGDICINGKLLSRPNFDGENDLVFDYLYSNPNKKFTRDEIESAVKPKPVKSFNKIVENLGFTKELRKYFFKVSDRSIQFNNPVKTKEKLL